MVKMSTGVHHAPEDVGMLFGNVVQHPHITLPAYRLAAKARKQAKRKHMAAGRFLSNVMKVTCGLYTAYNGR
jgi:hypothetical protein